MARHNRKNREHTNQRSNETESTQTNAATIDPLARAAIPWCKEISREDSQFLVTMNTRDDWQQRDQRTKYKNTNPQLCNRNW
jgi:hypothetical protein